MNYQKKAKILVTKELMLKSNILWRNIMEKLFYCYSYPLKEFLIKNDCNIIISSIHEKTNKKFWVFKGDYKLNSLLKKWRLQK